MSDLRWRRVLLKISGESLANPGSHGVDADAILKIARKLAAVAAQGVELAVVVGGGNLLRGANLDVPCIQSATADYMGMLATVMNAIALQDACESIGLQTRVQSAIPMPRICEDWTRRRALRHLEKGRVVILAAGTGNPHFTTDTAAAQRAVELGCNVLIKATQVDGIYDADPRKNPNAKRFESVSYMECLSRNLQVMDMTAFALCRERQLPILILNIADDAALSSALHGGKIGTLVGP